jgi:hypothetical protein
MQEQGQEQGQGLGQTEAKTEEGDVCQDRDRDGESSAVSALLRGYAVLCVLSVCRAGCVRCFVLRHGLYAAQCVVWCVVPCVVSESLHMMSPHTLILTSGGEERRGEERVWAVRYS